MIPADEPETVNHLVFVVHGIGSWCDLKFRKVTECGESPRGGGGTGVTTRLGEACGFIVILSAETDRWSDLFCALLILALMWQMENIQP